VKRDDPLSNTESSHELLGVDTSECLFSGAVVLVISNHDTRWITFITFTCGVKFRYVFVRLLAAGVYNQI
jgi:hypothetical protein